MQCDLIFPQQVMHEIRTHGLRVYELPMVDADDGDDEYIAKDKELKVKFCAFVVVFFLFLFLCCYYYYFIENIAFVLLPMNEFL